MGWDETLPKDLSVRMQPRADSEPLPGRAAPSREVRTHLRHLASDRPELLAVAPKPLYALTVGTPCTFGVHAAVLYLTRLQHRCPTVRFVTRPQQT